MSKNRNRVSPLPSKKGSLVDAEKGAWAGKQKNEKEGTVRRRRRSFEAGTEEYADYVQKRVFNKRESWRPFLWERRRFAFIVFKCL